MILGWTIEGGSEERHESKAKSDGENNKSHRESVDGVQKTSRQEGKKEESCDPMQAVQTPTPVVSVVLGIDDGCRQKNDDHEGCLQNCQYFTVKSHLLEFVDTKRNHTIQEVVKRTQ